MNGAAEKWAQRVLALGLAVSLVFIGIGFILDLTGWDNPAIFLKGGFWILLATPALRVVGLLFGFSRQKEKKFAWVSAGVLFVLAISYFVEKL